MYSGTVPFHRHKNTYVQRSIVSSPGGMELALVFRVGVTMNSNNANRRAGCVRDDDWLRQHGAGGGWSHATAAYV